MTLTKEEAIRKHRLMWNWIAQTSIQEQRCVSKREALEHFGWNPVKLFADCWCCTYAEENYKNQLYYRRKFHLLDSHLDSHFCDFCPVQWPNPEGCCSALYIQNFLFDQYAKANKIDDWVTVAKIAYQIAELPERKD